MKLFTTLFFLFSGSCFSGSLAIAQSKMVCVSWMDHKIEIKETDISEYATAHIEFDQDDWSYTADLFEGKLNYLTVEYKPLKLSTTSRSLQYPLNHLSHALEIDGKQATVDCDMR